MDWHTFWLLIGGNAALGVCFKLWFQHSFDKKLAQFRVDLENKNAAKLEILRLSLGKELNSHTARSSIFAQKQAEAIAEMFSKLFEARRGYDKLGCCASYEKHDEVTPQVEELHNLAADYFSRNVFYFPSYLAEPIEDLLFKFKDLRELYRFGFDEYAARGERAVKQAHNCRAMNSEIQTLIDTIRNRFHETLTDTTNG